MYYAIKALRRIVLVGIVSNIAKYYKFLLEKAYTSTIRGTIRIESNSVLVYKKIIRDKVVLGQTKYV